MTTISSTGSLSNQISIPSPKAKAEQTTAQQNTTDSVSIGKNEKSDKPAAIENIKQGEVQQSSASTTENETGGEKKVGKLTEALIRTGFTVAHGILLAPALAIPVCAAGTVIGGTLPVIASASVPLIGKIAAGFIAAHAAPLALALTAIPCAIPVNIFQTIQGIIYDKLGFENTMTRGSSYSYYNNGSDSSDGNFRFDPTGKTGNNHSGGEGGFNLDLTGMTNDRHSSSGSSGSGFDLSMLGGFSHK